MRNPFAQLHETDLTLPAAHNFTTAGHFLGRHEIRALTAAFAAGRPLLVRGEAGSGKSQLARVAAHLMGNAPLFIEVIHARFEALDLLYRFDAIERLADAQAQRLNRNNDKYVKKGRMWLALESCTESTTPALLIDEIDKADADIPNALLEVLGNRSFTVPPLGHRRIGAGNGRLPLIIITTNEERELPAAFVRRCMVLNLNPPADKGRFIDWLVQRGRVHSHLAVEEPVQDALAEQVWADRETAQAAGYPKVGLAEYIDLLTVLHNLTTTLAAKERERAQHEWLEQLGAFALVKHALQDQQRPALSQVAARST
jgi:MoxR-like ATPase